MYATSATIIVGRSESEYDEEPVEVLAIRVFPREDNVDTDSVTQATRRWLMDGRHTRFVVSERREYADVGAAGAGVTFVLTLLASGAVGVALHEIVNYMKSRIGVDEDTQYRERRFRELSAEDARNEAVRDAERALGLGHGDLEVEAVDRDAHEIRLRVRRKSNGGYYRVVKNADESLKVRKLGSD